MKEKLQKFGAWIKRAGIGTFRFLSSIIFLKNFAGVLLSIGAFVFLTSWWMQCYTNHGDSLQVHDYIGMQLADAQEKAESRSFEIIVNDSLFLVDKPPHTILEQSPKPLSRVKKNRKVYLTITKSTPDLVLLPDLAGGNDDYSQYARKIKRLSLNAKITQRKFSAKLEKNTILDVLYQDKKITDQLGEGFKVPMGSTIQFVVTEKGGGYVNIPNLVCQKYDAAAFLVGNYNLNIGSIIEDATVTNRQSAYVWKQMPRYSGSGNIRIGEQIDLYLTQYKPDNCAGSIETGDIEAPPKKDTKPEAPQDPDPGTDPASDDEENEDF